MLSDFHNREPVVAGQFYPGNSKDLIIDLNRYFSQAKPPVRDGINPRAIISPHAGYVFSANVAASAFNQIPEKAVYRRVFLIGSSHRYHFRGGAVYTKGDYLTPLGRISVDRELATNLLKSGSFFIHHDDAHMLEHSLEVQLPFLQQKIRSDFLLVPIVLGTNHPGDCSEIAKILEQWFTPDTLFVISTDFSHYPDYKSAVNVDQKTANAILTNNPSKLLHVLEENKKAQIPGLVTSLCGWTSVLTLMYITKDKPVIYNMVDYQNSGDNLVYGDKYRVVGYEAIAVFDENKEFLLTESDKKELIRIARETIVNELKQNRNYDIDESVPGNLEQRAGAFVSIYCRRELRGCIGSFKDDRTLAEVVRKMAVSATHDSRFKPLSIEELQEIKIEISVLTPLKKIIGPDEIEIGKHGIYIKKDYYSGTFLPQVATSRGWTREEFLGRCSRDKAGLGWDGWKKADLYTYEAIIIKEESDSPA